PDGPPAVGGGLAAHSRHPVRTRGAEQVLPRQRGETHPRVEKPLKRGRIVMYRSRMVVKRLDAQMAKTIPCAFYRNPVTLEQTKNKEPCHVRHFLAADLDLVRRRAGFRGTAEGGRLPGTAP